MSDVIDATDPAPRVQRALAKAQRIVQRVRDLELALTDSRLDARAREEALVALEALVLVNRGSSETDHRKQLVLAGLQAAVESFLADDAPGAARYAASADPDALLADAALAELRAEYGEDAGQLDAAEVARAVREWAAKSAPDR